MTQRNRFAGSTAALLLVVAALAAACAPKQTPLAQLTTEELWIRGAEEFNQEDWDDAIRHFERFVMAAGADPRIHQARYYIGQAHFNDEEYITAAAEFARLAGDLGRADLADDARFMACRSYEELSPNPQLDQEYTRGAIEHCQALIQYFPDSEFADEAAGIIERMRNRLAEKVFETGDWYERRRAYDSAIIYYEDVADDYPGTVWAPRALQRLIGIYEILQYQEELEEVRERLLREYPEAAEARELGGTTNAAAMT